MLLSFLFSFSFNAPASTKISTLSLHDALPILISNSSAFRMDEDVPLLIPEVNHQHLGLLERQRGEYSRGGFIVTNPNCSTIMLALALAPLHASFGVEATVATTLQALSGAGYPGVASLDKIGRASCRGRV